MARSQHTPRNKPTDTLEALRPGDGAKEARNEALVEAALDSAAGQKLKSYYGIGTTAERSPEAAASDHKAFNAFRDAVSKDGDAAEAVGKHAGQSPAAIADILRQIRKNR